MPDNLQREIEVLQELRAVIREAHEASKDLRADMQAARRLREEFLSAPELSEQLGKRVKAGLDEYDAVLQQAIKVAEKAMYNRFDVLTAICLGEDPQSVKDGVMTVPELLREFIATKGLPYRLVKKD